MSKTTRVYFGVLEQRLELTSRFIKKQANELRRQLSIELGEQLRRNLQEVGGPHRSPKQVENRLLPPHRREEVSLKKSNGERPNLVRTTALQRVYAKTNPITQPGVYNESLPLV